VNSGDFSCLHLGRKTRVPCLATNKERLVTNKERLDKSWDLGQATLLATARSALFDAFC